MHGLLYRCMRIQVDLAQPRWATKQEEKENREVDKIDDVIESNIQKRLDYLCERPA